MNHRLGIGTNCFNYACEKSEMSVSQRRGVITLVPKEDSKPPLAVQLAADYTTKSGNCIQSHCKENGESPECSN